MSTKTPTILIIDDDASLRDSLRRALRKTGYTVLEAGDGHEGLKKLSTDSVDVILLDIFMPGKEGLETIMELRRTHPSIHVIAMSGGGSRNSIDVLAAARLLGAKRTLVKPFSREQLLDMIETALASNPEAPLPT